MAKPKPKLPKPKSRPSPPPSKSDPAPSPPRRSSWFEWVRSILIAIGIALLIRWPLVEPFKIPSGSMEPTLQNGDRIFVNKYKYGVRFPFNGFRIPFTLTDIWYAHSRLIPVGEPQRWDIVVFKAAEPRVEKHTLVKRVIGLPGERIHIEGGKVFADGSPLELPPNMPDVYYTSPSQGTLTGMKYGILTADQYSVVPEGHYLVLGDNSDYSRDGRYFGWLPERNILGRVSSIWWPVSRWRDFTGYTGTWWWRGFVVGLGVLIFVRLFIGRSWKVYTDKFRKTLARGDHVYVHRLRYGIPVPLSLARLSKGKAPARGEVVLYQPPERRPGQPEFLLGRIAGLPGEQVHITGSALHVDGQPVASPSILASIDFSSEAGAYARSKSKEYSQIPADHYFILLDAPDGSEDSRNLGWIPQRNLIGPATAVWWPIYRARRIRAD